MQEKKIEVFWDKKLSTILFWLNILLLPILIIFVTPNWPNSLSLIELDNIVVSLVYLLIIIFGAQEIIVFGVRSLQRKPLLCLSGDFLEIHENGRKTVIKKSEKLNIYFSNKETASGRSTSFIKIDFIIDGSLKTKSKKYKLQSLDWDSSYQEKISKWVMH